MLYKFRCAMARFMYGRNGMDQLNHVLVWAYVACCLIRILIRTESTFWYLIGEVVTWPLFLLIIFRMFSKNLNRRREENQKFVSWLWKVKNRAAASKARREDKDHKYFTCKCGAVCRVPVGKGKVVITCPKCKASFQAKT